MNRCLDMYRRIDSSHVNATSAMVSPLWSKGVVSVHRLPHLKPQSHLLSLGILLQHRLERLADSTNR
jgi:hypothetical protein